MKALYQKILNQINGSDHNFILSHRILNGIVFLWFILALLFTLAGIITDPNARFFSALIPAPVIIGLFYYLTRVKRYYNESVILLFFLINWYSTTVLLLCFARVSYLVLPLSLLTTGLVFSNNKTRIWSAIMIVPLLVFYFYLALADPQLLTYTLKVNPNIIWPFSVIGVFLQLFWGSFWLNEFVNNNLKDNEYRSAVEQKLIKKVAKNSGEIIKVISEILNLEMKKINPIDPTPFIHTQKRLNLVSEFYKRFTDAPFPASNEFQNFINFVFEDAKKSKSINNNILLISEVYIDKISRENLVLLGLLLHELINNSLGHGFREKDKEAFINLSISNGRHGLSLTYVDNSRGWTSADLQLKTPESFGLQIIELLSKTLHGNYYLSGNKGCSYQLSVENKVLA